MNGKRGANVSVSNRIRWMAVAAVTALIPEIVLPLRSYLTYGYLTPDAPFIAAVLLPFAVLAFLAAVHEARPLWRRRWRQTAVTMVGLSAFGLLFASATSIGFWSGGVSCYECGQGWFFMFAFPTLVLEFALGVVWLILARDLRVEERRHFRGPLPGIR